MGYIHAKCFPGGSVVSKVFVRTGLPFRECPFQPVRVVPTVQATAGDAYEIAAAKFFHSPDDSPLMAAARTLTSRFKAFARTEAEGEFAADALRMGVNHLTSAKWDTAEGIALLAPLAEMGLQTFRSACWGLEDGLQVFPRPLSRRFHIFERFLLAEGLVRLAEVAGLETEQAYWNAAGIPHIVWEGRAGKTELRSLVARRGTELDPDVAAAHSLLADFTALISLTGGHLRAGSCLFYTLTDAKRVNMWGIDLDLSTAIEALEAVSWDDSVKKTLFAVPKDKHGREVYKGYSYFGLAMAYLVMATRELQQLGASDEEIGRVLAACRPRYSRFTDWHDGAENWGPGPWTGPDDMLWRYQDLYKAARVLNEIKADDPLRAKWLARFRQGDLPNYGEVGALTAQLTT